MARVVRKVSGRAVRGQKKGILYNKNFWIGISCGVVAILALVLGLVFGLKGTKASEDAVKPADYFAQKQVLKLEKKDEAGNTVYDENGKIVYESFDVNFEKTSYANVVMNSNPNRTDGGFIEYTFVFATDLSKFYPMDLMKDKETNLKNDTHEAVFNALMHLQHAIDEHNAKDNDYDVKLYIVDTVDNKASDNMSILTDTRFNGGATEATTILSLVNGDKSLTKWKDGDREKPLVTSSMSQSTIEEVVNSSIKYMQAGFPAQEK